MNPSVLEIQKLLRSGQTPEQVCEPLGISIRRKDGKVLFSYDQIESHKVKDHPVVKECRGLILYEDNWDICSMAFERFFNYGEPGAAELPKDLKGCFVLEKLDGTLISMYWDRGDKKWHCATRNMIDAEGPLNNLDIGTFAGLFWKTLKVDFALLNPVYTYVFELTSPYNRIVTYYATPSVTLLTVRTNTTGVELDRSNVCYLADNLGLNVPISYDMQDFEAILRMQKKDGFEQDAEFEGYVVVHEAGYGVHESHKRVKVKNPAYVALHRVATSMSERNLMELLKEGAQDDFVVRFPEWKEAVEEMVGGLQLVMFTVLSDWQRLKDISDRKMFALAACKCKFPNFLFSLKDKRYPPERFSEVLMETRTDALLEYVKKVKQ